ncbi:MAG: hypothetical protein OXQ31_01090 [Spirochaetaceae bacterium]|nr:hypothetical protein [Spirochaetaceae bacterium]
MPALTAALEAASGMYARAFAVAEVEPKNTITAALTPAILSLMARDLIRRGEFVHEIMVDQDVMLIPCGSWTVYGGPDPRTWRYRIVTYGASTTKTRASVPAAGVVHGRYAIAPIRPWAGSRAARMGCAHRPPARCHRECSCRRERRAGRPRGPGSARARRHP